MPTTTKGMTNAAAKAKAQATAAAGDKAYLTPTVLRQAEHEPTLYQHVLDNIDEEQQRKLASMTPFARELQLFIWSKSRPGKTLSHRKFALDYLHIPESTVNAWFGRRGTRPEDIAYQRVKEVTGWPQEHLLALTGYDEEPPFTPDVWDVLFQEVERWPEFDEHDRANVRDFLRTVQTRLNTHAKSA